MKGLCKAFFYLVTAFAFVIFWQKNIGAKAAHKIMMKLTIGVTAMRNKNGIISFDLNYFESVAESGPRLGPFFDLYYTCQN